MRVVMPVDDVAAGASGWIVKPTTSTELLDTVQPVIN